MQLFSAIYVWWRGAPTTPARRSGSAAAGKAAHLWQAAPPCSKSLTVVAAAGSAHGGSHHGGSHHGSRHGSSGRVAGLLAQSLDRSVRGGNACHLDPVVEAF